MTNDFDYYKTMAEELIKRDDQLKIMQQAMDRMANLEYTLPAALQKLQWVRKSISTAPYDALRGATRALSNLDDLLTIDSISIKNALPSGVTCESLMAKNKADEWEKVLKWNMALAIGRKATYRSDLVRSALLYDEVCAQVVHLPTQIRAIKSIGGNPKRQIAAQRNGPFVIKLQNPQNVHARRSDYMLEGVLSAVPMQAKAIVDFWGDMAAGVQSKIDQNKDKEKDWTWMLFDWTDYDKRVVWCAPGKDEMSIENRDVVRIMFEDMQYPFINWVNEVGGTDLDQKPEHQRQPLLYPIFKSEKWIEANITATLLTSEAIAEMGMSKRKVTGPNPDAVEESFGEPGGHAHVPPGHDIIDMEDRQLDPALKELADRHEEAIRRATVSSVLVTAEQGAGETFSGFNLRVKTAIGALIPYKSLAERTQKGIYSQMLLYAHYAGFELSGYSRDDKGKQYGPEYTIDSEDINPDTLYMGVDLTPDVPIDRLQQINGAVMLSKQLPGVPTEEILKELGVADPLDAMRRWRQEQYINAYHQGKVQLITAQASQQIQQMAQQMAQAMQQQAADQAAQQQAQQGQDPNAPPGGNQPMDQGGPIGMPGVGGNGMNPAVQGTPPANANPAMNIAAQQTGSGGQSAPF